jgi:hypothetical protein
MEGKCESVVAQRYSGNKDKDTQRCSWRGKIWDCNFSEGGGLFANSGYWVCDVKGDAPAEAK